jgi:raffinose/stachyose/melibiose transport system substrate-binding protein
MKRASMIVLIGAMLAAACGGGTSGPPTPAGGSPAGTPTGGTLPPAGTEGPQPTAAGTEAPQPTGEEPTGVEPTTGGSPAGGSGVLKTFVGIAEDPEIEQLQVARVERFEAENPDIDVQRESIDNDQLRSVLQTRLRSNNPPDIFGYDTGPGFGGVLARAGLLYDLTAAYEEHGWQTFDWALSRCTYGGMVGCVPGQVEEVGIFYNKTLFDEKAFAEPETLDELRTISDAFKADGLVPIAFGNQPQWPAGHQYSMTLSNIVGREGLDARLYSETPWNTEDDVKAIDIYFNQFRDAGYFPPDPNAISYEDANALFYDGGAAMVPTGTWLVAEITDNVDFETGFFPFPSIDGSSISPPAGLGGGTFVAANAQNPEGAIRYLDWILQDEQVQEDVEVFNTLPAQPVDTSGMDLSPLYAEVVENLAESSGTADAFGYNIDVLTPAGFNQVMFEGFQEVLNGTRSAQEQADALEAAYNEAEENGETIERP